jgi:hypothetical protein
MSYRFFHVALIGTSLILVVIGCSRTDNSTNRLSENSVPNRQIANQNSSVAPKSDEKISATNGDSVTTETSPESSNEEIQDSDEPRIPGTRPSQPEQQPQVADIPVEDGDDPNAVPIEAPVQPENETKLDDGREAGAKPNAALISNAADPAASVAPVDERGSPTAPSEPKAESKSLTGKQPLPEKLQALDTNKDGQIALAEWPREKLAEFTKLDKDKNGFVTSQEWLAGSVEAQQQNEEEKSSETTQPNESPVDDGAEPEKPASDSDG